jgi:D-xylose transport system substrate-binding protein
VLAANDGMSLAAQSVLQEAGLQVPTTGQDAQVEALRALLTGDQCVSIYKPIAVEADSVVDAAVALLRGSDPPANSTINDGDRQIPFVQAAVTPVFKEQVVVPIQDGFVSRDAVCDGIEELCQGAGIG